MSIQSVYSSTARFDTPVALDDEALFKIAPSIFQTEAHDSRSERFIPIPTIEIVHGLRKEGFDVVAAKQALTRVSGKADFTKHLLRFRRLNDGQKYSVGSTVLEMLLKNANDGSSVYELLAGLFRVQCQNSLVAQTSTIDTIKVRHSGKALDNVIEGTHRVLEEAGTVLAAPRTWSEIQLSSDDKLALANAAHIVRFGETKEGQRPAIDPRQLLLPRRASDQGQDLWTVSNVIQESCIRGGLHGVNVNANNQRRRVTTRQINGIDQDIKINKGLWALSEYFAQQKMAA